MLYWRKMELSWRDCVRNEQVLQTVMEERNILRTTKGGKTIWIGHILLRKYLLKHVNEGDIEGTGRGWMKRKQLPDNFKETRRYCVTILY
jgi:hypothetical protein